MITKLQNPKSRLYYDVKDLFTGGMVRWHHNLSAGKDNPPVCQEKGHDFMPYLSHPLLIRPEMYGFSMQASDYLPMVVNLLMEILTLNNKVPVRCFHRINVNLTFPTESGLPSETHKDHEFEHENMLIYLTDNGGSTVVENEIYEPREDDIICFPGLNHYMYPPKTGGRVIIVATYETVN